MQSVTALLLSAGLGTRLGQLTRDCPKPLLSLGPGTLINAALWHFKAAGLTELWINLHYLPEKIKDHLGDGSSKGLKIHYSLEDPILDTGGAIKRVLAQAPGRDLLVFNSDAIFERTLDLGGFIQRFQRDPRSPIGSLLLVSPPNPSSYGAIQARAVPGGGLVVCGIPGHRVTDSIGISEYVFSGVQVLSHRAGSYMANLGEIFGSFKALYPAMLKAGESITGELFTGYWQDSGTPERLEDARQAVGQGKVALLGPDGAGPSMRTMRP